MPGPDVGVLVRDHGGDLVAGQQGQGARAEHDPGPPQARQAVRHRQPLGQHPQRWRWSDAASTSSSRSTASRCRPRRTEVARATPTRDQTSRPTTLTTRAPAGWRAGSPTRARRCGSRPTSRARARSAAATQNATATAAPSTETRAASGACLPEHDRGPRHPVEEAPTGHPERPGADQHQCQTTEDRRPAQRVGRQRDVAHRGSEVACRRRAGHDLTGPPWSSAARTPSRSRPAWRAPRASPQPPPADPTDEGDQRAVRSAWSVRERGVHHLGHQILAGLRRRVPIGASVALAHARDPSWPAGPARSSPWCRPARDRRPAPGVHLADRLRAGAVHSCVHHAALQLAEGVHDLRGYPGSTTKDVLHS